MKRDEWDELATRLESGEPLQERKHRDPNLSAITAELRSWWAGIRDGSIKFLPGLPLLAEYFPAYIPGHLITVSGYTSAGKSQLLSQFIGWTAGVHEEKTLVFSLEDARMEKLISLASVVAGNIHRKRLLLGDIEGCEENINIALKNISHWPLMIYDDVYRIPEMEGLIKKHEPRIVLLDYVQNTTGQGTLYERMASAAIQLFRIAQEYKITLFVASQIDNESARSEAEGFIGLKGGGELAAASHGVIHLKKGREENKRNKVRIQIKKNKAFGPCGEIDCQFNEHWTVIESGDRWTV